MSFSEILVDEKFLIAMLFVMIASFSGFSIGYFIVKIEDKIKSKKTNQQYHSLKTHNCVFCNCAKASGWVQIVIHKKDSHLIVIPVHNDCLRKALHENYVQQINV